jgi:hypothetical protein
LKPRSRKLIIVRFLVVLTNLLIPRFNGSTLRSSLPDEKTSC